ncbi:MULTISPECIES: SixA phosphatase family protein [Roseateles]|uniref:Histidine phosphatase family protein n=1 Tax=Roseateles albus TaxID=2987525 RepID=A0ABT5KIX8_9BURK|nr:MULTISPECIES: histidine phosphatase family protein [Roseateles]MCV2361373.1 histidine phosphatase family protein [Paucibacter sp. TC2R-5]MDC8773893.1 histidine phosphatase family protein [Roseateles albus]
MDLILWRHAEAELLREGSTDLQRCLTPKGERQAKRMAAWLNQRMTASTRVLVSPAQRTVSTAEALGREFRIVPSIAPDASVEDLLAAARWPDATEPTLLIGHQPTLGMLAALLLTGHDQPWSVKKGAVWWLRSRERDGQSELLLQAVQAPDFL